MTNIRHESRTQGCIPPHQRWIPRWTSACGGLGEGCFHCSTKIAPTILTESCVLIHETSYAWMNNRRWLYNSKFRSFGICFICAFLHKRGSRIWLSLDGLLHFEALSDFFVPFAFWSFRVCLFKRDTLYWFMICYVLCFMLAQFQNRILDLIGRYFCRTRNTSFRIVWKRA